jgi:D-3-phosphoglycerate dehydrogenase / 2-oxoglutarate reductase
VSKPRVLFLTDRGERHQRIAVKSAPPELDIVIKRRPSDEEIAPLLPETEFIISERNLPVTGKMIAAAPNLKLIVRLGSLSYDIDLPAARERNIRVSVQPVPGSIYSAEHVLMLMLGLVKRFGRSLNAAITADHGLPMKRTDENTFAFNWLNYTDIGSLYGKSVAIVGMGEIGVELARRLKTFRLKTIYYNKRVAYPKKVERELWITYATEENCFRNADIVVSLLPFTAATDRSIGAEMFKLMKPGALFVHAGSGSVVDEQALAEALRNKALGGAALDTYEYEPLQPTHSLVTLARDPNANLLLTPHTAAAYIPADRSEDFGEIIRYLAQSPLQYEIT